MYRCKKKIPFLHPFKTRVAGSNHNSSMPSDSPSKTDSSDEDEETTTTQESKTPDVNGSPSSSDEEQEEKPELPPKRKRKKKETSTTEESISGSKMKSAMTIEKEHDSADPEIKAKEEESEKNSNNSSETKTPDTKKTNVKSGYSRRFQSIFACSNPWLAKSAKVHIREHRIFFAHTHLNSFFKCMRCCCCRCCHESKITDSAVHTSFIEFPYLIHEQLDFNYVYDLSLTQPWYSCCCCGIGKIDLMTGTARERTKENHQTVTIDCIPRSRSVFDALSKFLTEGNFRQFRVAAKMNVGTAIG